MNTFASILRRSLLPAVVFGLALTFAPASQAATVQIISLRAVVTEDDDGDECRLRISVDGGAETVLSRFMRNGNIWTINRTMHFHSSVRVKLYDHDDTVFNPDDHLGTVMISTTPGTRTGLFNLDGAHYVMTYKVTADPPSHKDLFIRLVSLRCIVTEDDDGDELRMKVRPDSRPEVVLSRFMRPGNIWSINREFRFDSKIVVRLFDHDDTVFNPDDLLGTLTVTSGMTPATRTFIFNLDGAHYVLTYQILRK